MLVEKLLEVLKDVIKTSLQIFIVIFFVSNIIDVIAISTLFALGEKLYKVVC
jgi:hypothetical protein